MAENDIAEETTSDDSMLTIRTDETLRELDEHGTPGFPFVYYLDDLDRYAGRREEWHWHIEFEWCVAERGEVDCLIDSDRIRLREGDGIFIGSRVIHGFESAAPAIMPNVLFPPSFLFQEGTDIYTESMLPVLDFGDNLCGDAGEMTRRREGCLTLFAGYTGLSGAAAASSTCFFPAGYCGGSS